MKARTSFSTPGCLVSLAVLATLLILGSGCGGVVPMPTSSSKPVYGRKLERAEVAFIQPGKTTREEVIERLGYDYTALPLNRALAYTWELPGGGGVWWYVIGGQGGGAADGDHWVGGWRGFLVAFNDRGIVTATAFKQLSARRCLAENMNRWLQTLPRPPIARSDLSPLLTPNLAASSSSQPSP